MNVNLSKIEYDRWQFALVYCVVRLAFFFFIQVVKMDLLVRVGHA